MNERESQIRPGERVVLLNKMEAQRREGGVNFSETVSEYPLKAGA